MSIQVINATYMNLAIYFCAIGEKPS